MVVVVSEGLPGFEALVVDDDDVDRERLARLLRQCHQGITVREAGSVEEATHVLRERPGRLSFVFLDFNLHDGDGRDLLPQIRESAGADCIVVAVTGNSTAQEAAQAIKQGIHEYVNKTELNRDALTHALEEGARQVEHARERRRVEQDLLHKSLHDALTDLPNRHVFFDRLNQLCSANRREPCPFAVMMVDLNRFKHINDHYGHAAGDAVLTEVARRMHTTLREVDTVARLGGDEFAILLPGVATSENAQLMGMKLVEQLEQPVFIGNEMVQVGASIGVVVCPVHGTDAALLLRRADEAMYRGKQGSRPGVVLYDSCSPHSTSFFLDRLAIASEYEHALQRGNIEWYWQPQVDLRSGTIVGIEGLVRWRHEVYGMVPTDAFIAALETSDQILPFTLDTVDAALTCCGRHAERLQGVRVSFNVSARLLEHPGFVDELIARVEASGVDPAGLTLELTETALICNPVQAQQVVDRLSEYGVSLSIDDFGAGFTSFGYLRDFKVSEIKIDKSYILDLPDSQFNQSLVRCLAVFCRDQQIALVAEGIETPTVWELAGRLGCPHGQGYGIARPMPCSELGGWLDSWRAMRHDENFERRHIG